MTEVINYIASEKLILIPVLYVLGMLLKSINSFKDKYTINFIINWYFIISFNGTIYD